MEFEPGTRVDVLTYNGEVIPGVHTVVHLRDGYVRVRRVYASETTCDDWQVDRVRRLR